MVGNRRHAGGMKSTMVNLKKIDARIVAKRTARASAPVPQRLGKEAALRKYERFKDRYLEIYAARTKRLLSTTAASQ